METMKNLVRSYAAYQNVLLLVRQKTTWNRSNSPRDGTGYGVAPPCTHDGGFENNDYSDGVRMGFVRPSGFVRVARRFVRHGTRQQIPDTRKSTTVGLRTLMTGLRFCLIHVTQDSVDTDDH